MLDPPGIDAFVCQNAETPASFLPSFLPSLFSSLRLLPSYLSYSFSVSLSCPVSSSVLSSFVLLTLMLMLLLATVGAANPPTLPSAHHLLCRHILLVLRRLFHLPTSSSTSSSFALPFSKSSVVGRRRNAHAVNRTAQRVQSASPPTNLPATLPTLCVPSSLTHGLLVAPLSVCVAPRRLFDPLPPVTTHVHARPNTCSYIRGTYPHTFTPART